MNHEKLFFSFFTFSYLCFAQLTNYIPAGAECEVPIYVDSTNNRYSTLIYARWNENIFDIPQYESVIDYGTINNSEARGFFSNLEAKYGTIVIEKLHPDCVWGDTIGTNRRTGATVNTPELSQIFTIRFTNLVNIDSVMDALNTLMTIDFAELPLIISPVTEPNDPYYYGLNGLGYANQWGLDSIQAKKMWDITTGKDLLISINDTWSTVALHSELNGKFINENGFASENWGGHGIPVAGVAGCLTNNNAGIASLNWDVKLHRGSVIDYLTIKEAVDMGADIINFSWYEDFPTELLKIQIKNALIQGVVCVAGAGNTHSTPIVRYPAAYHFGGAIGQVIAVSATCITNNGIPTDPLLEHFAYTYNYSPGTDPISDPENSFIDVVAPGITVMCLPMNSSSSYGYGEGTSFSAPLVSSLVSVILSINNTLTVPQVYEIITQSVDKIKPSNGVNYQYDQNGWTQLASSY